MKRPFNARIARIHLLSTLLIIAIFTACLFLLFYVTQRKNITTHVAHLKSGMLQAKRDFVKNTVYRTIHEIDSERESCKRQMEQNYTDETEFQRVQHYCRENEIKKRMAERIRNTYLIDDGYIWVNEILDDEGGDDYAVRLVHPNPPDSEGMLLSTRTKDIKGNTPYQTELDGVKEHGELFFSYWFKKKTTDAVSEKLAFAKLYPDYNWVVASGVYLDDIAAVVDQQLAEIQPVFNKTLIWVVISGLVTASIAFFVASFFQRFILATIKGYMKENAEKEQAIVAMNENLENLVWERTQKIVDSEQMVRESEQKYSDLYNNAPDMFASVDAATGCILDCNLTLCRSIGLNKEEIIGKEIFELYHPDSRSEAEETFARFQATGKVTDKQMFLRQADGSKLAVSLNATAVRDANGTILFSRSSWRDVTELKKMEVELRQAQKMEAIGTLAGGIAHDFNNILASILGYTELALEDVEQDPGLKDKLLEVQRAGNRAKGLVRQILTFARQTDAEVSPLDITPIAKELIKFIRSSIPTTIAIESSIVSHSLVMANPSQIHQILMNLCTNSAYAMAEKGGRLTVEVKDTTIYADSHLLQKGVCPGEYLQITVSDTGTGISPEIIHTIFEPYFTTKGVGEGTGIGLSVVHGIVTDYGGIINVNSAIGVGTTFDIYLPITKKHEAVAVDEGEPILGGSETILVVDDEEPLARLHGRVLEQLGYNVIICTDSVEALGLFRAGHEKIEALLTDMTMPGLTGERLAEACREIKPDLVTVICTGYSDTVLKKDKSFMEACSLVQKPILKRELARVLRQGLDSRA
jgi:PAS domain S-box-containing protein